MNHQDFPMLALTLTHQQAQMLLWGKMAALGLALLAGGVCWRRGKRKVAGGSMALAVVAALSFLQPVRIQRPRLCIANLKEIDGAVQQWALESKKAATDTYSLSDPQLLAYMRGSTLPVCWQGGRYTAGTNVGDVPKCSLAAKGHTL